MQRYTSNQKQKIKEQCIDSLILSDILYGDKRDYRAIIDHAHECGCKVLLSEKKYREQVIYAAAGCLRPLVKLHSNTAKDYIFLNRIERDKSYFPFWTLIKKYLPKISQRCYIGLPGYQIHSISRRVDTLIACETNNSIYEDILKMSDVLALNNVFLWKKNIIEVIGEPGEFTPNIYDLDLMGNIPEENNIDTESIYMNSQVGHVFIYLNFSYGRNCTKVQTFKRYGQLLEELEDVGFEVVEWKCEGLNYVSNYTPMWPIVIHLKKHK